MKIAYFTDTFLPNMNGVVTSLLNLTLLLADHKHNIHIYAPLSNHHAPKLDHPRISVTYLPSIPSFIYPEWRTGSPISPNLIKTLREFNPDVLHVQTTFTVGGGGLVLGRVLQKPVLGCFHGYFMEPEYLKVIGISSEIPVLTQFLWKFAAVFYNQCSAVMAPALVSKQDLIKHNALNSWIEVDFSKDINQLLKFTKIF